MSGAIERVHATAIAIGTRAALIRGAPGSGKSDLALRCMALAPSPLIPEPARLVADDQVCLESRGLLLFASAPPAILGRIEVRGLGIFDVAAIPGAEVVLAVDLAPAGRIERLPDPWPDLVVLGHRIPVLRLAPFEASAPLKLLLALSERALPPHQD